uniref:Uncharacterized protein n=1 Tax=Haptolina ericina TaxID=156174 RepID=A0A7S3AEM6_9EUKA|mmetsp:Transcript_15014/g.33586  ORF Transcript_15014/g.33586 Transcript_15014/m.33586 type:complete len:145 (+) Transcript_15014:78-512(+)
MKSEGVAPGETVFIATDEQDRAWFAPIAAVYNVSFAADLEQGPLLDALLAFPQPLWPDVLAILEQLVCILAPRSFVGTLPSTLSGHIVNARQVVRRDDDRPLFTKLHESCCDARTALDLMQLPGMEDGDASRLPCIPHRGNPWC